MQCKWKPIVIAASGLLLALGQQARAVTTEAPVTREQVLSRYQAIVDRNPFGLKPPPPPPAPPEPPKPPEPKLEIFLTGISSVYGPKRAFLKSTDATNKDPSKKDSFYSLTEGQSKDGIEILQIDGKKREVKIRNAGAEKVLTFASNGIKPPATGMPTPGMPGMPGSPGGQPGMPGAIPPPINTGFTPQPQPGFGGGVNMAAGAPSFSSSSPVRSIPSRVVRGGGAQTANLGFGTSPAANPPQPAVPSAPAMSPEEQYLMIKANEQMGRKAFQRGQGPEPAPVPDFHLQ